MKRSTHISLILIGSLGLGLMSSACGANQQRHVYQTYQECKQENPEADCESEESGGGGGSSVSGGGGNVYYGPWKSSLRSSKNSVGVQTQRGGFGIRSGSSGRVGG